MCPFPHQGEISKMEFVSRKLEIFDSGGLDGLLDNMKEMINEMFDPKKEIKEFCGCRWCPRLSLEKVTFETVSDADSLFGDAVIQII